MDDVLNCHDGDGLHREAREDAKTAKDCVARIVFASIVIFAHLRDWS